MGFLGVAVVALKSLIFCVHTWKKLLIFCVHTWKKSLIFCVHTWKLVVIR